MPEKDVAVFGIYATSDAAECAVDYLVRKGFANSAISVLLPDEGITPGFAHEKHTKAPEGAVAGVVTGGVIGGAFGLVVGLGALAVPGLGPLMAAGPIIGALAGLGAGGAVGGIVGAMVGLGIPEFEAKRYEGGMQNGGVLLSVHCTTESQIPLAKQSLRDTGAKDIVAAEEEVSALQSDPAHHAA